MKVKVRSVVLDSISFRSTQCTLEMDQIQLLFKEIAREAFSFTHINLHSSLYRLYQSQKGRNKNSYMCKYIFSKWMQRACTHSQTVCVLTWPERSSLFVPVPAVSSVHILSLWSPRRSSWWRRHSLPPQGSSH